MKTFLAVTFFVGLTSITPAHATVFPVLNCHMTEEYMDYGLVVAVTENLQLPRFPAVESTKTLVANVIETTIYGKADLGRYVVAEKDATEFQGKRFDLRVMSNEVPNEKGEYRAHLTVMDQQQNTLSEEMLCSFNSQILE